MKHSGSHGEVAFQVAQGTLFLAVSIVVIRLLGLGYRAFLPLVFGGGAAGAFAVGVFGYGFSLFQAASTMASNGLSTTLAPDFARHGPARDLLGQGRSAARIGGALAAATILAAGAWHLAFRAPGFAPPLLFAAAAYLVFSAAPYRGLLHGEQRLRAFSISQTLEQLARVTAVIGFAWFGVRYGMAYGIAGAAAGVFIGSVVAVTTARAAGRAVPLSDAPGTLAAGRLLRRSLPVAMALGPLQALTLVALAAVSFAPLAMAIDAKEATTAFGTVVQMALPIVSVPAVATTALATALIPAASRLARDDGRRGASPALLLNSLRMALFVGAGSCAVLLLLADALATLWRHADAAVALRLLAPVALFYPLYQPAASWALAFERRRGLLLGTAAGITTQAAITVLGMKIHGSLFVSLSMGFTAGTVVLAVAALMVSLAWQDGSRFLRMFGSAVVSAVAAGLAGYWTAALLVREAVPLPSLFASMLAGTVFLSTAGVLRLFSRQDLRFLRRLVRR